jgi:NAD(P)-dependent dehydrogenase (short-subunit alcohol dehydrogenase family)
LNQSLEGRVVFVTGANGGLGEQFVLQALERGATRVYAAARAPKSWNDERIMPIRVDLTDAASIAEAAAVATDVDLVVNNAGIAPSGDSIQGSEEDLRTIFETNFFGLVRVSKAFAPVLAGHGGGTLLNVLSAASWLSVPTGYAASKAAAWSATNALRVELDGQGTQVVGLLVGMVDTPMSSDWDVPKVSPQAVVAEAYDGVASGALEVLADDPTRELKAALATPGEQLYPFMMKQLTSMLS